MNGDCHPLVVVKNALRNGRNAGWATMSNAMLIGLGLHLALGDR